MSRPTTQLRKSPCVLACLVLLLLSRGPAMLCRFELNMDESQMAAQAMRYSHDLTPWRSVEGETNGPLDSWFLLAAHSLGMPFSYRALHVLAALCLAALLLATYAAMRRLVGETAALAGLIAGTWWLAWTPVEDLVHYSSELIPALLVSLALAAVARARQAAAGPDWRQGLLAGLLLGLAPWGKLQVGPVALAVGLWAAIDGWLTPSAPSPIRRRYVSALVIGAVVPGILLLGWVAAAGAGPEFWRIYVMDGLYHGRARPWAEHLQNLRTMLLRNDDSPWFWEAALLLIGTLWLRGRAGCQVVSRRVWWLALVWLGVGLFVALRPITQRTHYAIFFLPALALFAAVLAEVLLGGDRIEPVGSRRRLAWIILGLGLLPLPVLNFANYGNYIGMRAIASTERPFMYQIALAGAVRHFVPNPSSLAIWGWKPSLYVDLGLPPATRNAVCAFLTDGNPNQEFLRAAYMQDLEKSQPQVVVDVEDFVYRDQRKTAVGTFPALAGYLRRNYAMVGSAEARRSADYTMAVVIYRRRTPAWAASP